MEALAAVSLAGNILQFPNFTSEVISKSRQIHTSVSGTLKEHDDLESLATDLKGLSVQLQASTGPVDSVLEQLCSRCSEVADELLKAVERLGVKGNQSQSQSLRKTLKLVWGKEKLQSLEERLAQFRQELTLHVTVELRYIRCCILPALTCKADSALLGLELKYRTFNKHSLFKLLTMLQTCRTTETFWSLVQMDRPGN